MKLISTGLKAHYMQLVELNESGLHRRVSRIRQVSVLSADFFEVEDDQGMTERRITPSMAY